MKVVERFTSINGEGQRAGELAMFVRFKGCNLSCSYCDTMWANEDGCPYTDKSPAELYKEIIDSGVRNVTLTGGEPLLQKEMPQLLALLSENENIRVEVETNGSIDLSAFSGANRPSFTMDYKLPSSGCESKMLLSNFQMLQLEDTVKFVVGSREDLDKARRIIEQYHLTTKCKVYLSPVFGKIEPALIVQFMIAHHMNDVRMQIQMHKVIWDPNERGV
ncbi:putative 7-carboxy-7-deazaguanine synthase QueE [Eubacterium oxidoreducens]|uniref:7-carboxy-7-deazaguanine synthase n=1 Tax=Eubacterium oxidoreducens TaxID=1732 RepID=A0A1G6A5B7_EUBOX|nr:putative 7-carboxy-7-deazaguanine synthase QueE [Eubacterium oxidoreducens]SDB03605.1 7-carboxy-7-deazaguanine synthase [Eubacterium oxidoreducens]